MYLTDYREYSLKDVITQFEPGLFKKVTGLSVKDFELLVSIGIFNDTLMNSAIYNFKRYEDASLEYTGINKHADDEKIGLFSTVISKEDYENMAMAQTASMQDNPFKTIAVITQAKKEKEPVKKPEPTPKPVNPGYSVPGLTHIHTAGQNTAAAHTTSGTPATTLDLSKLRIGTIVLHKKYGEGRVEKIASHGRIMVTFAETAPKTFIVPTCFEQGFLTLKEW